MKGMLPVGGQGCQQIAFKEGGKWLFFRWGHWQGAASGAKARADWLPCRLLCLPLFFFLEVVWLKLDAVFLIISLIILMGGGSKTEQAKQERWQKREDKIFISSTKRKKRKASSNSETVDQRRKGPRVTGRRTGGDRYPAVCFGGNNSRDK